MADNVTNELLLEHLKALRTQVGTLQNDVSDVKTSLISLRQHLTAFMSTHAAHEGALASLQARPNRIERRLEISET